MTCVAYRLIEIVECFARVAIIVNTFISAPACGWHIKMTPEAARKGCLVRESAVVCDFGYCLFGVCNKAGCCSFKPYPLYELEGSLTCHCLKYAVKMEFGEIRY